jgi:hypothetical protein
MRNDFRMQVFNSRFAAVLIVLLAICFTLLSQNFVRPVNCQTLCGAPEGTACPAGACRMYEQRAGLPLPFLIDAPGGGSPTNGWGILGPEDLPDPFFFLLDVGFYALLLWLIRYLVRLRQGKATLELLAVLLPAGLLLAMLIGGFFLYRPFLTR